jgi:hypothetical protein
MRRSVAPVLAVVLLRAAPALATEPLDLDLARLGAPSATVWSCLEAGGTTCPASPSPAARQAALDARQRFALLSSEMALALTNTLLEPASTTGMSGFDVSAEAGYAQVHADVIGQPNTIPGAAPATYWPTHTLTPHELFVPSVHVRKALPFSFEVGGRILYLSQSSYFGAQIEGRWALAESMVGLKVPDVAVRVARTQLYGQRDWRLGATDVDLVVSKRFGVNGVTSFTPYAGARFTFLDASTVVMDFNPARATAPPGTPPPLPQQSTEAAFPTLHATFYRTTVGVRMTSYLVSMAGEVTYGVGGTFGTNSPSATEYPKFKVRSSLGGAFRFGFEF